MSNFRLFLLTFYFFLISFLVYKCMSTDDTQSSSLPPSSSDSLGSNAFVYLSHSENSDKNTNYNPFFLCEIDENGDIHSSDSILIFIVSKSTNEYQVFVSNSNQNLQRLTGKDIIAALNQNKANIKFNLDPSCANVEYLYKIYDDVVKSCVIKKDYSLNNIQYFLRGNYKDIKFESKYPGNSSLYMGLLMHLNRLKEEIFRSKECPLALYNEILNKKVNKLNEKSSTVDQQKALLNELIQLFQERTKLQDQYLSNFQKYDEAFDTYKIHEIKGFSHASKYLLEEDLKAAVENRLALEQYLSLLVVASKYYEWKLSEQHKQGIRFDPSFSMILKSLSQFCTIFPKEIEKLFLLVTSLSNEKHMEIDSLKNQITEIRDAYIQLSIRGHDEPDADYHTLPNSDESDE